MPLNIAVNENYRITSDSMNIILLKRFVIDPTKAPNWEKRKAEGASPEPRDDWREIGYYRKVEDALNDIVNKTVYYSDASTLGQLLSEIKQIRREISAVLSV